MPTRISRSNSDQIDLNLNGNSYSQKLPEGQPIYVVDFFCGAGGMSYGFKTTRQSHFYYKILAGIDIDSAALRTYEENIGSPGLRVDVATLAEDPESLRTLIPGFDPEKCRPLLFIGCPPCQGFSAHRKKDKRDDFRNNLLTAFAKLCLHFTPDSLLIENVPEVLTGKYRAYFHTAARMLENHGYKLTMDVLDFSLFGVPQRRRRAIALGARQAVINLPSPIFNVSDAPTVRHAIAHLPSLKAGEQDPNDPQHRAPAHTARILRRIERTPPNGGDRRDLSVDEQLDCHAAVDTGRTPGFTDVYGRLRWDTPSVTITAKSSTPSCGRFLHPEQHRNISVREAGLLQGFPHSFSFLGPLIQRYRQIGEAVPPLMARSLAWSILDAHNPKASIAHPVKWLQRAPKVPKDHSSSQIAVVDAFCGAGGMALGFQAAGFRSTFGFDLDENAVETFNTNIGAVGEQKDIQDPALSLKIAEMVGKDDFVVIGGPPCQGFSQQRRGDALDERNDLVLSYASMLERCRRRPAAVVLENVTYLDSPRGRHILDEFSRRMQSRQYTLFRHDMNSADFCVPQLRHRILLVAIDRKYAVNYSPPEPLTPRRWATAGEAFFGLPSPESAAQFGSEISNHTASNEGEQNKRRIAFVDMSKGRLAIPPELQLACHSRYDGHLDVYGRLDWFGQARTITGGFDSFTRGEFAHPFLHRSITFREAARLQGFPDWYTFSGNRAAVRRQIGNAVPPPMAYSVAKAILLAIRKGSN